MAKTIMIIHEQVDLCNFAEEALIRSRYNACHAWSVDEALFVLRKRTPAVILLDLGMKGLENAELVSAIAAIPVIGVYAQTSEQANAAQLKQAPVGMMQSPFSDREMLARVEALLLEQDGGEAPAHLFSGDLFMDARSGLVTAGGKRVHLTNTEQAILRALMRHPDTTYTKAELIACISPDTEDCTERSLKQHICNMRKKLSGAGGKDYILSVWSVGFRLSDPNDR